MKKISKIILSIVLIISLSACQEKTFGEMITSTAYTDSNNSSNTNALSKESGKNKILIVYFGRKGNTNFPTNVDATSSASLVVGNDGNLVGTTEFVAKIINEKVGGDLQLIKTKETYPENYETLVSQNRKEQAENFIPELEDINFDISKYDTIFLGFPIWAMTLPQAIISFLSKYDFSSKTIIPFCTHAGYGSGSSFSKIKELCPNANVLTGLALEADEVKTSDDKVSSFINSLGIINQTSNVNNSKIIIKVGNAEIKAELNETDAAKEFRQMLPLTVSMRRMGEHEYYGALEKALTHTNDLQTGYTVGDLAFWTPGDLFAIYFDKPQNDPQGLMILGHITSDMSVFNNMGNLVNMQIDFDK